MYKYEDHRDWVFTDEGQRAFLACRDKVKSLLATAGAFQSWAATGCGDSWRQQALLDRQVELGELRVVKEAGVFMQHQVYVKSSQ